MPSDSEGFDAQRFLIVTADDYGLHPAVNEAVERASRDGILNAASLMVSAPAAADAVQRAVQLPNLRVGLHLVLTDGHATLARQQIPSWADAAGHMDDRMFARAVRLFASRAVRRQVAAEIRAQFDAFARTGLDLDHVNVHKHFHMHPTLLDLLVRIGREYGAHSYRVPAEPVWFAYRSGGLAAAASAAMLAPWAALMKRRLRAAGLFHNDQIFGLGASGAMVEARLLQVLNHLPRGNTEIYLHPATLSGNAVAASMSGYRHREEFAALLSPQVRAALVSAQTRSGGYSDARRGTITPLEGVRDD